MLALDQFAVHLDLPSIRLVGQDVLDDVPGVADEARVPPAVHREPRTDDAATMAL